MKKIIIGGISLPFDKTDDEICEFAAKKLKKCGIHIPGASYTVSRKSVDARRKDDIKYVSSVIVEMSDGQLAGISETKLAAASAKAFEESEVIPEIASKPLTARPLIVGMGPAGLFCALLLAENGYAPIIIDRGGDVDDRAECTRSFETCGALDTECNIQYGAGGAGTFSDGKLLTRINDPRSNYVINRLSEFGAPEDIKIKAKPHIGTDILRVVVSNILEKIKSLGGTVIYRCRYEGHHKNPDGRITVNTAKGDLVCGALVLALGNSARDTFVKLIESNFDIAPKPISVGVRIEHLREDIDKALYGNFAGHPMLGAAEYALSDTTGDRGVYTFCMCPGGRVVAAASEEGGVVVNGMSEHARDGRNSNCAVAVSVRCEDYPEINGNRVLGAIEYQRKIERAAYFAGGGNYYAPVQTAGDFLNNKSGTEPARIIPSYMSGKFGCTDLNSVFPSYISENLKRGLLSFDRKLHGFAAPDAVLSAAETRTSAPLRILRGDDMCAVGREGIFPCGEGAGYAGGITSASVDGIRTALAIMKFGAPADN